MKEISYYRDKNYWYFRYGNLVLGPHNIDRVKTNIKELPNRIKRSNDLIYPERKKDGLNLICSNDDSFCNVKFHQLEQTNRFFNLPWLLHPSFLSSER